MYHSNGIFRYRKNRGNGEAGSQHDSLSFKAEDEEESGEGLTTLIPDIRATAKIVEVRSDFLCSRTEISFRCFFLHWHCNLESKS